VNSAANPSGLSAVMVRGPRGAFRWTAYVLGVTAFMAAIPTPLYGVFESQFHFSAGVLGLVFAAYTPGVFVTLFYVAPAAERVGRRKLLFLGMVFTAVAAVLFATASGVAALALARAVSGLGVGATTSVATAAMSDLEPNRDQHHVARVAVAANFGAFAIGVAFSAFLVTYLPYPTHLVFATAIVAAAVGVLAIRATPETAPAIAPVRPAAVSRIVVPADLRRPFWVAAGGVAACYSIYGLFAALGPAYVRTELASSSPLAAGGAVAAMFGMAAIIQLATSQIRDRRALLVGFPIMLAAVAALVGALLVASWPLFLLVSLGLGIAVGLTYMGSVTLVDRIAPERLRDEILAGFYLAAYLSLAIPTIGVAEASERIGLADSGILFGALLAIATAALFVGIYRTPTPAGGGGRPRAPPA
jgi:MFS family permease